MWLQTLRTHAAVIILLRRGIRCRSVLRAHGRSSCHCMMRLPALRACAEPSVVWQSVFRSIAGQTEPECFPTPNFVVWIHGIRTGCGSWHLMWGVIAPFPFFPTYVAPPKRPSPYSRPLRRPCESSLRARYQIYRDSSTSRMVLQFASVHVSRPLAQSGHRVNCLPTWSVLWVP